MRVLLLPFNVPVKDEFVPLSLVNPVIPEPVKSISPLNSKASLAKSVALELADVSVNSSAPKFLLSVLS